MYSSGYLRNFTELLPHHIIFHLGTLPLGAKRSGTKDFSSLMLENSKCRRFRNGPALEYYAMLQMIRKISQIPISTI